MDILKPGSSVTVNFESLKKYIKVFCLGFTRRFCLAEKFKTLALKLMKKF